MKDSVRCKVWEGCYNFLHFSLIFPSYNNLYDAFVPNLLQNDRCLIRIFVVVLLVFDDFCFVILGIFSVSEKLPLIDILALYLDPVKGDPVRRQRLVFSFLIDVVFHLDNKKLQNAEYDAFLCICLCCLLYWFFNLVELLPSILLSLIGTVSYLGSIQKSQC